MIHKTSCFHLFPLRWGVTYLARFDRDRACCRINWHCCEDTTYFYIYVYIYSTYYTYMITLIHASSCINLYSHTYKWIILRLAGSLRHVALSTCNDSLDHLAGLAPGLAVAQTSRIRCPGAVQSNFFLGGLDNFWDFWRIFENFGEFLRSLENFGEFWRILETLFVDHLFLVSFGIHVWICGYHCFENDQLSFFYSTALPHKEISRLTKCNCLQS